MSELTDVYDRAYENAMRQGYHIDTDVLNECIRSVAETEPPFSDDRRQRILDYIKEKPQYLPADKDAIENWLNRWRDFFAAETRWREETDHGKTENAPKPPLLCDFGL